jgi:hypothetical protein
LDTGFAASLLALTVIASATALAIGLGKRAWMQAAAGSATPTKDQEVLELFKKVLELEMEWIDRYEAMIVVSTTLYFPSPAWQPGHLSLSPTSLPNS